MIESNTRSVTRTARDRRIQKRQGRAVHPFPRALYKIAGFQQAKDWFLATRDADALCRTIGC